MSSQRTSWTTVWIADLAALVIGGPITAFFVFLIAYGFDDTITAEDHIFFLAQFAVIAVVWGVLIGLINLAIVRHKPSGFAFAMAVSWMAHLLAVAIGIVVSMTNEEHNSITADQADGPFVAVAIVAVVAAVVAAGLAVLIQRRKPVVVAAP